MATLDCRVLIEEYINWLTEGFELTDYGDGGCRIMTPYWRSDGDHIEIFTLPSSNGKVLLSDEGLTTDWLYAVGIDTESEARQAMIEQMVTHYGLNMKDGELHLELDSSNIDFGMHRFLTAIRSISQMTMLRRQRGTPTFKEEVELYLLDNEQKFDSRFKVSGNTMKHTVDFYLNTDRKLLLDTMTATSVGSARNSAKLTAFKWLDIDKAGWDYQKVVVLDDSGDKWEEIWNDEGVSAPLETYSDRLIRWGTERGQLLGSLVK